MCDTKPKPRCSADTSVEASQTEAAYRCAYPVGPAIGVLDCATAGIDSATMVASDMVAVPARSEGRDARRAAFTAEIARRRALGQELGEQHLAELRDWYGVNGEPMAYYPKVDQSLPHDERVQMYLDATDQALASSAGGLDQSQVQALLKQHHLSRADVKGARRQPSALRRPVPASSAPRYGTYEPGPVVSDGTAVSVADVGSPASTPVPVPRGSKEERLTAFRAEVDRRKSLGEQLDGVRLQELRDWYGVGGSEPMAFYPKVDGSLPHEQRVQMFRDSMNHALAESAGGLDRPQVVALLKQHHLTEGDWGDIRRAERAPQSARGGGRLSRMFARS